MANNYLLFSTAIPKLNKREKKWWEELLALQLSGDDDPKSTIDAICEKLGVPAHCIDSEAWPEFSARLEGDGIWFYSDECGDAYKLAMAIHAFIKKFRPKEIFWFSVAYTCSSPRLDEFSGEDYVISKDGIFSNLFVVNMLREYLSKRRPQKMVLNDSIEVIVRKAPRKKGKK